MLAVYMIIVICGFSCFFALVLMLRHCSAVGFLRALEDILRRAQDERRKKYTMQRGDDERIKK